MTAPTITGAKGGGTPYEATDTLRSTQQGEVVDLLGEGQIGGLVNGMKSIYLDGVPVQNADDSLNFPEFAYQLTLGGPTSEAEHGFGDVQTEVGVGVTVLHAVPVVRTISDATADAVRVTITVPQLVEQKDNGDRVGASFDYAIDIQSAGGGYVERWADTLSGKASSPYQRAIRLSLTEVGPAPWDVRVRRVSADSANVNLINAFSWASYTVISGVKMLYRNSAVCRLVFDAKNFSSIPQRWYDVMGISDWDIPVNYDPLARTVSGSWSGAFKQGWTNNPAWVIYNLVRHPRYGLGDYVPQLPDKWTLYQLALWADVPLSDGRGGTEPRYSVNAWVTDRTEALRLLQDICSVFRGVLMHSGSTLTVTWDAPGTPVASYTPANVVDGLFTYADGSEGARKTSCTCWYTDRRQAGKREMATWDDDALVTKYGIRNFEINPIGVASPSQALRMAKWALYTSYYEAQTVSFKVGEQGRAPVLGEIFQVTDPSETGERLGGRIHSATTTVVTLDAPVTLASGETYTLWVTQPHATDVGRLVQEARTVTTGAGTVSTLTVSPAFSAAPLVGTVWLLEGSDVAPTLWRYVDLVDTKGEDGQQLFDVVGVRHYPGKFDLIEANQPLNDPPTRRLSRGAPRVASISITESLFDDALGVTHIRATISWPMPAPGLRYLLAVRGDNGPWASLGPISQNLVDVDDVQPGVYDVQVQSVNAQGQISSPTTASATIVGDNRRPPDVAAFAAVIKPPQVVFSWTDRPRLETELRLGADWDTATFGWAGVSSDFKLTRPPNGTYTVLAKHRYRDKYSLNAVSVTVTIDDSIDVGGGGGGTLVLTVDGPPLFRFATSTTHTTTDPDLHFTARLINLFGEVDWVARAFSATVGGTDLGAVTLLGTGNARTLTPGNFVAPGSSGSVKRVDVTASQGTAAETLSVYRYDPSVTEPFIYLDNPTVVVEVDEAGLNGNYSQAVTGAAVLDTGADVTSAWTLSIEPDAGITSLINGVAGPVTGAAAISVAVSNSTLPDGVVLVRGTKAGETDITAPFRIVLRKPQGAERVLYFAPRTDIVLDVDSTGAVTSYTNAWTNALVRLRTGVDATSEYTFEKTDVGVTSTLTGTPIANRITITGWLDLGTMGTPISTSINLVSAGWGDAAPVTIFGDGVWLQLGRFGTFSYVKRSLDYQAWADVSVGTARAWELGGYTRGAFVVLEWNYPASMVRSIDGGLTWSAVSLPISGQWQHVRGQDGTFIALAIGSVNSLRSTDAGASWSVLTTPSSPSNVWGVGTNKWLFKSSSGSVSDNKISLNNGTTWSSIGATPDNLKSALGFKGLIVASLDGAGTHVIYSENNGATWVSVPLPVACAGGRLLNIRGVLYCYSDVSGALVYSTDGKKWAGGATSSTAPSWVVSAEELDIDFVPLLGGAMIKVPLLATSATEAAVHVRAKKPGEPDLTGVIPVQRGAATGPNRVANINPAVAMVPSTEDGVVTDYSNAKLAVTVVEDSTDTTSGYAWSWTATNLTPATGTGALATFTAMSTSFDSGRVSFVGVAAGKDPVMLSADVVKIKDGSTSGLDIGAAYTVSSRTATYIEFRLTSDGQVQTREGTSGTWLKVGNWANPPGAGVGAGGWVRYDTFGTVPGSATVGGTLGSFLSLTSDRGVSVTDTTPGDYQVQFVVYLSAAAGGTNPRASLLTMLLHVP